MLKIITISIIGILVANMIKEYKSEYSILTVTAVSICLLMLIIDEFSYLKDEVGDMLGQLNIDKELSLNALKLIFIAYMRKFGCDICTDFGYKSIAGKIDISARLAAAVILLPHMYELYVNIIKLL